MIQQLCAICEKNNYDILYKENFNLKKIDERVFSARRLPDRIHYQIVRCRKCSLIYSNPILEYSKIEKLYKRSFTSYEEHFENLKETYGFYLTYLKKCIVGNGLKPFPTNNTKLLEIGCGNGFFLEEAKRQGYHIFGIEPGIKSVQKARKDIKKNIIEDIFKPGLYKKNFFDVICCFQTFDHVPNPNEMLKECYKILKKGGLMLFLNHDASSLSAKILSEKSPIIDIEHTYLYNKKTMPRIFRKHRFKILEVKNATNIHTLSYWLHLFPLPNNLKLPLIKLLDFIKLGHLKIKMNPGNLVLIAQKRLDK